MVADHAELAVITSQLREKLDEFGVVVVICDRVEHVVDDLRERRPHAAHLAREQLPQKRCFGEEAIEHADREAVGIVSNAVAKDGQHRLRGSAHRRRPPQLLDRLLVLEGSCRGRHDT